MKIGEKICALKDEKDALVLAHNYQRPEIQDVADFVGDSLELARMAERATKPLVVFCGVLFMAETAKILNPKRKVLVPVKEATCPLADQLAPAMLNRAKADHPNASTVVYINSTAACKALADVVCTSSNAVDIVRSLDSHEVIVAPDANLAAYVQSHIPEKRIIAVPQGGHCYVHQNFTKQDVLLGRDRGDTVICHPECRPEVQEMSDYVASTGRMVTILKGHPPGKGWTILTEREMGYRLRKIYPDQNIHVMDNAICRDMKRTTLQDLLSSLEQERYEVILPEEIMEKARGAIRRMVEAGR